MTSQPPGPMPPPGPKPHSGAVPPYQPGWLATPTPPPLGPGGPSVRKSGEFVGTVTGGTTVDAVTRHFLGVPVLVVTSLLAGGLLAVDTLTDGGLLAALVWSAVVLAALLLIYRITLGRWFGRALGALGRLAASAFRTVARIAARLVASTVRTGVAVPRQGTQLPVRRFRVQSLSGEMVSCVLTGELVGDEPRHGDVVRISGHQRRDGRYAVHRLSRLAHPAGAVLGRAHARPSVGYRLQQVASVAGFGLSALVLAGAAALIAGLIG
ncbi:hypothetical protein O7632_01075 [Solwaraspora sp. WMMD406]|uniref:hypothetical protein n=1 Tax=Solwaraspora sp. WMMD406 TaxID=3016095 RepID=UPI0024171EDB|nr:hypothetical protein [Solwaraspora sp. WMMD406]MDG4762714.1 hypothetical protein [Solwaraspora sp. WMMD406]